MSTSTLPRWILVSGDPDVGDPVRLLILICFGWTEDLISSFPMPFDEALVGEVICIGCS